MRKGAYFDVQEDKEWPLHLHFLGLLSLSETWLNTILENLLRVYTIVIMSPSLRVGGHIDFGADPVGVNVPLSCLHNILRTSGWILSKFLWIYNWDITNNRLDFGDLDLIFKITALEKLKIHG